MVILNIPGEILKRGHALGDTGTFFRMEEEGKEKRGRKESTHLYVDAHRDRGWQAEVQEQEAGGILAWFAHLHPSPWEAGMKE